MTDHPLIGKRLGSYEVTALIGVGGMGEVYRATDTKLKREVAIKVLPAGLVSDPGRLARSQREAEVLASLNHPNIAAIYGLEDADNTKALVMELVEGPTLADRIAEGAIPIEEALPIARQIAEALEAAHDQGIIHRDLKPANVKVRPDGTVKVLDFGLAKTIEPTTLASASVSQSPTLTGAAMTQAGMILGTAAYMSPEQARGRAVDRRADIWAFGCVLYEMLTGKRAFEGEDVTEILAAVMRDEPKWLALPRLREPLWMFLKQCLKKDPKLRLGDIREIRLALEGTFESPVAEEKHAPRIGRWRERAAWAAVLLTLIGIVAIQRTDVPSKDTPETTLLSFVPENAKSVDKGFALATDGRTVVYSGKPEGGGSRRLWLRSFEDSEAHGLAGSEGGEYPFWSPDGTSIGFFADGNLKRIPVAGGAAQTLCEAPSVFGGSWGREGVILFAGPEGIYSAPAAGGESVVVHQLDLSRGEERLLHPSFLPDGRRYLYVARTSDGATAIWLASLDSDEPPRELIRTGSQLTRAEYIEPGILFYLDRSGLLVAQRVHPDTLEPKEASVPMSSEAVWTPHGRGAFSVSTGNILIFQTSQQSGQDGDRLLWVNRQGRVEGQLGQTGAVFTLAISPDQTQVAANLDLDIWLYDVDAGIPTRFTANPIIDFVPAWAPDGKRIAFTSTRTGSLRVYVKGLGETGEGTLLEAIPSHVSVSDWSRDGEFLILRRSGPVSYDIWSYSFAKDQARPLLETRFDEQLGQLSPNGHWLAYTSDEAGENNVYVTPFPSPGPTVRVSPTGGAQPRWRDDGQELFYLAPDGSLMALGVSGGDELVPTRPTPLFRMDLNTDFFTHVYDVSSDGERFLVIEPGEGGSISVLSNWASKLGRSTPAG